MITGINSEDRLVQQTFAEDLEKTLGWDSVYAYNDDRTHVLNRGAWAAAAGRPDSRGHGDHAVRCPSCLQRDAVTAFRASSGLTAHG